MTGLLKIVGTKKNNRPLFFLALVVCLDHDFGNNRVATSGYSISFELRKIQIYSSEE